MIIIFGSLSIDLYIPANELPAPGMHISCDDYDSFPGGKGANQAFSASRAGAKTAIVGRIGDDAFGRRSTQNLKRESILGSGIGIVDRPTGCSFILPGKGEDKTIISCEGANLETTSEQIPNEILTPENIVVSQLLVPVEQTLDLFSRARARGTKTVLNASPPQYVNRKILEQTDLVFVNKTELKHMFVALRMGISDDIEAMTRQLCQDFNVECVTTLGSKGAYAYFEGQGWRIPAYPIEKVVDANGGGDCFLGYLLALLNQNYSFAESMQHAAIAGSMACSKMGAQSAVPFLEDVAEAAKNFEMPQKA